MNKKIFWSVASITIVIALFAAALAFTGFSPVQAAALEGRGGPGGWQSNAGSGLYAYASGPLSADEEAALVRAIQEEQTAQALYQGVIDQFGSVLPFSSIVRSETQHLAALTNLAQKYGVALPAAVELAPANFTSLSAACQAGVDAEIADAALYDELSPLVSHTDILRVFDNLQRASLNSHLPIFEACN